MFFFTSVISTERLNRQQKERMCVVKKSRNKPVAFRQLMRAIVRFLVELQR